MAEGGQPRPVQEGGQEYAFRSVELYKNETLGTGSYGAVCKAKCDELICAAKLLYPVLFEMQPQAPEPGKEHRQHRQPFRRFELECRFLSHINHPNIVQYLGTYRDPDTNAPVLLMELMDESLTHFLESSSGPIPHHVQVNLCYDIAQALAFLHSNGIIHRDLSSNNVLLLGNRAKVTDFGMSKFADIAATRLATMTTCPGTPAFMSPEALNEPPVYTEKLDNFSLGVVIVQIETRKFPNPTNRFQVMQIPDPRFPTRTFRAQLPVPEAERRHAHIRLIDPTHPLLPIALHCLKDEDVERPSSQQLCQTLGALEAVMYEESPQQDIDRLLIAMDDQILTQTQEIVDKTQQLEAKETEVYQLTERLEQSAQQLQLQDMQLQAQDEELVAQDTEIHELAERLEHSTHYILNLQHEAEANEGQLRRLNQLVESNEEITAALQQAITQKERAVSELKRVLSSKDDQILDISSQLEQVDLRGGLHQQQPTVQETSASLLETPADAKRVNLVWESLPELPSHSCLSSGSSAVCGNQAYFSSDDNGNVLEYNCKTRQWCKMPKHPTKCFTLVCVEHMLTSVGGFDFGLSCVNYSNKLFSLIDRKWVEHFPVMRIKRQSPAVVYTSSTLVVAGGVEESLVATVEVLSTHTKQWFTASSLPISMCRASAAIYKDYICITACNRSCQQVFVCSRLALIASTQPFQSNLWKEVACLPVIDSSLATVNGCLLAIGGRDSQGKPTADIYQYKPTIASWEVVSQMSVASYDLHAAVLPENKIMIVQSGDLFSDNNAEITTFEFCCY